MIGDLTKMRINNCSHSYIGILITVPFLLPAEAQSDDVTIEMIPPVHALGVNIVRIRYSGISETRTIDLQVSEDGAHFRAFELLQPDGKPTKIQMHDSHQSSDRLIPVVANFDLVPTGFLFEEPGTHHLRWRVYSPAQSDHALEISQSINVGPVRASDREFLDSVMNVESWARVFGGSALSVMSEEQRQRLLGSAGANERTLLAIRELIQAPSFLEPSEVIRIGGGLEQTLERAEFYSDLAHRLGDSSYAPYAAYYAGTCYLVKIQDENRRAGIGHVSSQSRDTSTYSKATAMLQIAYTNGDRFLKPRAYRTLSFLYALGASWTEAFKAIDDAIQFAGLESIFIEEAQKLRSDITKAQAQHRE